MASLDEFSREQVILAALRTTAVRDGDDYVINGQKMWTSLIAYADYVWLAVRTNPEAKKHRGISMLIVPTSADGFSWTLVHTSSRRSKILGAEG